MTSALPGKTKRVGITPTAQRRQAKRRQAFSRRLLRFDSALPVGWLANLRFRPPTLSLSLLGFSGWRWSKLLSLTLLAATCSLLVWLHTEPAWFVYRENVTLSGARLLDVDKLYQLLDVEGWSIFWLKKEELRQKLLTQPWVTNAEVRVELPARVMVEVAEAPAIATWVTEAGEYWVAASGAVLPLAPGRSSTLPRVVDPQQQARSFRGMTTGDGQAQAVQPEIVESALALIELMPGLSEVRYSPEVGLNFGLPDDGPWVYWGDGRNVERKLKNIALGRNLIASGDVRGSIIDVRYAEKPLIR